MHHSHGTLKSNNSTSCGYHQSAKPKIKCSHPADPKLGSRVRTIATTLPIIASLYAVQSLHEGRDSKNLGQLLALSAGERLSHVLRIGTRASGDVRNRHNSRTRYIGWAIEVPRESYQNVESIVAYPTANYAVPYPDF